MPLIYKISNDINQKLYIGKTAANSLKSRWSDHLRAHKRHTSECRKLYRAMSKYGTEHFRIDIIEECKTDEEACEREKYWIQKLDTYRHGYNATLGGDGKAYIDHTAIMNLWNTTDYHAKKIAAEVGCHFETVRNVLHQNNIDTKTIRDRAISDQKRAVCMFSKDNEFITRFNSVTDALRYLDIGKSRTSGHIAAVCKGIRRTFKGYKWMYEDEYLKQQRSVTQAVEGA